MKERFPRTFQNRWSICPKALDVIQGRNRDGVRNEVYVSNLFPLFVDILQCEVKF